MTAPDHLTKDKPVTGGSTLELSEHEFWCADCCNRVTFATSGKEYGHAPECQHHVSRRRVATDGGTEAEQSDEEGEEHPPAIRITAFLAAVGAGLTLAAVGLLLTQGYSTTAAASLGAAVSYVSAALIVFVMWGRS